MIGQAMLYTVAVGVPIFLAAALGAGYLRRHGRAERWVWMVALGLSFAVPVGMMAVGPTSPPNSDASHTAVPTAPPSQSPGALAATVAIEARGALPMLAIDDTDIESLLLGLWLFMSLALAARWAVSAARLLRMRRSWRPATVDGTPVFLTEAVGPAVAGFLRPVILAPAWVLQLPPPERRWVLLHESEHIRAGDPTVVALGRLARVMAPWNPVVWLITSRLVRAVELDCDRRVLSRQPDVAAYGATLLMISARTSPHFMAAAFAEADVPLRRRILAMTTPPRALGRWGTAGVALTSLMLLGGATRLPAPDASLALALQAIPSELEGGGREQLPPITIVADPGRQLAGFILPSGEIEAMEVAPVGRWFPESLDGRTGFVPVPNFPRSPVGIVGPPPADVEREQLTSVPRILNPTEVLEAKESAYPRRLREMGLGGTVGVLFLVERTGVVQQRRIGQVSAYPELDAAALEVARRYRFSGASTANGAVPVWVSHAIDFRVE